MTWLGEALATSAEGNTSGASRKELPWGEDGSGSGLGTGIDRSVKLGLEIGGTRARHLRPSLSRRLALPRRDRGRVQHHGRIRIEQLEREVAQTRRDLDSKSTQLHDLEARLRSEREAEHGMSASKAEAMGRLADAELLEAKKEVEDAITSANKRYTMLNHGPGGLAQAIHAIISHEAGIWQASAFDRVVLPNEFLTAEQVPNTAPNTPRGAPPPHSQLPPPRLKLPALLPRWQRHRPAWDFAAAPNRYFRSCTQSTFRYRGLT